MYEFTHGIDHAGKKGIAPILVVGKTVCEQDFLERDLSDIQGIYIRQRGLDKGAVWKDLNIALLAQRFAALRYLYVEFEDQCDLSDFGSQPFIEEITLICPKLKQKINIPQFQNARQAELQLPTQYLSNLMPARVEKLELVRPKFSSLEELPSRQHMSELRLTYARNLETMNGIENFPALKVATLCDCPNLVETGNNFEKSGIHEIWLSGVKKLKSIDGLVKAKSLTKATVIDASKDLMIPELLQALVKNRA